MMDRHRTRGLRVEESLDTCVKMSSLGIILEIMMIYNNYIAVKGEFIYWQIFLGMCMEFLIVQYRCHRRSKVLI